MIAADRPKWLKVKAPNGSRMKDMEKMLNTLSLETVCQNASCPNICECFNANVATFMIMGNICTRNCRFCAVSKGQPTGLDPLEPWRVAQAVEQLNLTHAVITSVTRDDLLDGGANHFAEVIKKIRLVNPGTTVEVLIPDFQGDESALLTVLAAGPTVLNHNIETVPGLYPAIRPKALFGRSIKLLEKAKMNWSRPIITKSGIMVGLGETKSEVLEVFQALHSVGCDVLTIGQYLQPSKGHVPVKEYVSLETFDYYKERAMEIGFKYVASGPFVRSSYNAREVIGAVRGYHL